MLNYLFINLYDQNSLKMMREYDSKQDKALGKHSAPKYLDWGNDFPTGTIITVITLKKRRSDGKKPERENQREPRKKTRTTKP
jgi:hypothetical protein